MCMRMMFSTLRQIAFASVSATRHTRSCCRFVMAARLSQTTLKVLWTTGRKGDLCAKQQLKALCYREVLREMQVEEYGMTSRIAQKLCKNGGGLKG